jgi:phosphinothricin acetyltransferase
VLVRDARREDAPTIAEIYRTYVEQSVASFEDVAPDAQTMAGRMLAEPRLPWLVAEDAAGRVLGYAYASRHRERAAYRWAVECSVYLRSQARGLGAGRLLYATLLPVLRDCGYRRAYAGIALPNPGSVGLHEAMGFVPVGVYRQVGHKLGAWHDVGWWQLCLVAPAAAADPPEEPRPWRPAAEQAGLG